MDCPKCGYSKTLIIKSRNTDNYTAVRRRRQCQKCGYEFTTKENVVDEEYKTKEKLYHALNKIKNIIDDVSQ